MGKKSPSLGIKTSRYYTKTCVKCNTNIQIGLLAVQIVEQHGMNMKQKSEKKRKKFSIRISKLL